MRKLPHFTQHKQGDAFGNISVAGTIHAGDGPVLLFASSFDGRYLAAAIQDKIILYEVTEAEPYLRHVRDFIGHTDTICDLDFTSSGDNLVLSASCDKSVKVWYVEEDKCLATFRHDEVVSSVAFNPANPSIFVACTFNGSAIVWNIGDNSVIATLDSAKGPLTACGFSPDGSLLATGTNLGLVTFYRENVDTRAAYSERYSYKTSFVAGPRKKKPLTWKKITSITFLNNENVFVCTNDDRVRLFSTVNFSLVRKYLGHTAKSQWRRLAVSPDGTMIMMASESKSDVFIWDVNHEPTHKGRFIRERNTTYEGFQLPDVPITSAAFLKYSTRSKLFAVVGDEKGTLHIVTSA